MFKLAIVAVLGGRQPALAQEAISEPGLYAFYHPNADVLNAGLPVVSSAHTSVSERGSGIDDHVPTRSLRHHRH